MWLMNIKRVSQRWPHTIHVKFKFWFCTKREKMVNKTWQSYHGPKKWQTSVTKFTWKLKIKKHENTKTLAGIPKR